MSNKPGGARPRTKVQSANDDSPAAAPAPIAADSPARFFNRELSLLGLNFRVMEEAREPSYPLLERLRFLAISATILDPPKEYDYTPGYYALFFADPDGLKLEVVHEPELRGRAG